MKAISVVVADDHAIVRDGLCALLRRERDIEVVGEAPDGEETLRRIEAARVDVAVVDIDMPRMTGIEVARRVRETGARTAIVLVSVHKERSFVRAAFEAGAAGYVAKESTSCELIEAVRATAAGDVYLSRAIGPSMVAVVQEARGATPELGPRERDIVRLLARELSSKEIGAQFGISVGTVNWYRATIMEKVGVRSVAGLVKYAIREHLATLDE